MVAAASLDEQTYIVPLEENQSEPIRGRLEHSRNTPEDFPGWRWLQCTDYPGQYRILIPPKIASIYARLLEAEKWELNTYLLRADGRPDIVWERVARLRALKNKMLRRCMKIVGFHPYDPEISFQPFQLHAPSTFTVSSLEKWAKTVPFFDSPSNSGSGSGSGYDRRGSADRTCGNRHISATVSDDRQKRQKSSNCGDHTNNHDHNHNHSVALDSPEVGGNLSKSGEIILYDHVKNQLSTSDASAMIALTAVKALLPNTVN